ncbi:hypothetical protein HanPSC8_Chr14g0628481 [Helianthus annuus]|nr:hypothetical protein HanPSC8_Chr14g0628481 [Helianthus annuus]
MHCIISHTHQRYASTLYRKKFKKDQETIFLFHLLISFLYEIIIRTTFALPAAAKAFVAIALANDFISLVGESSINL